jgi:E3 ubiquitin-protein ligase mind-bomb
MLSGKPSLPSTRVAHDAVSFCPGEKVKVYVNEEQLKNLQSGHGGWNPRMVQVSFLFAAKIQ